MGMVHHTKHPRQLRTQKPSMRLIQQIHLMPVPPTGAFLASYGDVSGDIDGFPIQVEDVEKEFHFAKRKII